MNTFIWWHVSNALVRVASLLPLSIYPHVVARLGLPPHCASLDDYRQVQAFFKDSLEHPPPKF